MAFKSAGIGAQLIGADVGTGTQGGWRPPAGGGNRGIGRAAGGGGANTNWTVTNTLYSITDIIETMKMVYLAPAYFRDTLFRRTETCWGEQIQFCLCFRIYLKECAGPRYSFSETQRPKLSHLLRVKPDSQIVQRSNVISNYIDTDSLPCRFCF
jgi:hypothetical protein